MADTGMQQGLGLGLTQTTILAPQLQQSLHILQAPMLELQSLIRQELETNPVLEEAPPEEEREFDSGDDPDDGLPQSEGEEIEPPGDENDSFLEEFQRLSQMDDDWRSGEAEFSASISRGSEDEERRKYLFDSIPVRMTLQQHLLDQLQIEEIGEEKRRIAELLIGNIDEAGYLATTVGELASSTGLDRKAVEEALALVQSFDPPGVGARDLRESLLLQLRHAGMGDSLEARIVEKHLDDLARHRYPDIARRLKVRVDQVQAAAEAIARLDPRPGNRLSPDPGRYILPEASIIKVGDRFEVVVNNEHIPHLRISRAYKEMMANGDSGAAAYLREKIRGGKFVIKSIQQRQQTIEKICRTLLDLQRDFFEKGPAHLKPLTMSAVAERIGVHETTVSRAINGKFIETPHGNFEMRYFFTSGYQIGGGETLSNTSVKEAVAELVRGEDPRSPLSDMELVERLAAQGIHIARRTVAKYRDELGILPSNLRRRY